MTASHIVPLEVLPPLSGPADTILGAHIGTTDYLLPPLLEAADADGATILCIYGSDVLLSGIAGRLEQYQFVNSSPKSLMALTKAERETVCRKLTIAVEKAIGENGD